MAAGTVRAKFRVAAVIDQKYTEKASGEEVLYGQEIRMHPVYSPEEGSENHTFWKASPSGSLTLFVNNPQVFGRFREGQEMYLDFTPAEAES